MKNYLESSYFDVGEILDMNNLNVENYINALLYLEN